jgi:hypothetical protein
MYQDYTVGIGGSCDTYDPPWSPWCSGQFYPERQFPGLHTRHPSGFQPNAPRGRLPTPPPTPPLHPVDYSIVQGALHAGSDLESGSYTLAEAKVRTWAFCRYCTLYWRQCAYTIPTMHFTVHYIGGNARAHTSMIAADC